MVGLTRMCCLGTSGYACEDIIGTIFRVAKAYDMGPRAEGAKLEFLKVTSLQWLVRVRRVD